VGSCIGPVDNYLLVALALLMITCQLYWPCCGLPVGCIGPDEDYPLVVLALLTITC
jgi:hypothetical protein